MVLLSASEHSTVMSSPSKLSPKVLYVFEVTRKNPVLECYIEPAVGSNPGPCLNPKYPQRKRAVHSSSLKTTGRYSSAMAWG